LGIPLAAPVQQLRVGWGGGVSQRLQELIIAGRAAAIVRRAGAGASQAHGIAPARLEREDPFQLYPVQPAIAEVILVQERLPLADEDIVQKRGILVFPLLTEGAQRRAESSRGHPE